MPKPSKSKTGVVESVPVVNTPVLSATDASVVKSSEKKESKPKAVKAAVKTESVTPTPTVTVAPVEPTVVESAEGDTVDLVAQSTEFLAKLNQASTLFTALKVEFRSLEKKWSREIKTAQKSQAKRKRKSGNRQPSGFVKPTKISDELAKFLEKPVGTEMARTDVTREINTYIRAHKLQDVSNGRKINPDAKLAALLKLNKTDELTYFNLQRYMSPHFFKADKTLVAAAAPAPSASATA
jgi:upstream activation factor subunit UAF30